MLRNNDSIRSGLRIALVTAVIGVPLALVGCDVDREREGEMPDVDVSARGGQIPEYEVEKTREGELPDVDVDVDAGRLPDYDIDGPDIDVGMKKKTIDVPKVRVVVEEEEVEVPYIDIDAADERDEDVVARTDQSFDERERTDFEADSRTAAGDSAARSSSGEREERTVTVRLDASEDRYDLDIEEVYLADDALFVISRLQEVRAGTTATDGSRADGEGLGTTSRNVSDSIVVRAPRLGVEHIIIGERVDGQAGSDYRFVANRSELEGELRNARLLYRAQTRVMDPAPRVSQR